MTPLEKKLWLARVKHEFYCSVVEVVERHRFKLQGPYDSGVKTYSHKLIRSLKAAIRKVK